MLLRSLGLVMLMSAAAVAAEVPETVLVPAGPFLAGSDRSERQAAYQLDEAAYGHSVTRQQGWYEGEQALETVSLGGFDIMTTPVTNQQYAAFVADTAHPPPDVSRRVWAGYGLIHPFDRTRRHAWTDAKPPKGREDHPVVLVSRTDAEAYADWLSRRTGERWRLPGVLEWEKAARGTDGRWFPWGNDFDVEKLNSHDAGPFDTVPVGAFPPSPYGVFDMAGQVFEWTAEGEKRAWVKGGSWDDKGCGVCRAAARHTRPIGLKHILIGFRLVKETP